MGGVPDDATKILMKFDGQHVAAALVELCIDESGRVTSAHLLRSSSYPRFDRKILSRAHRWRYRPCVIDGKLAKACTPRRFAYYLR